MTIDKNILVTGGGGFLGKAIVKKLVINGCNVNSFARHYYPELESLGVNQIQGDLQSRKDVIRAAENCDIVFHVAAKAGIWGARDDYYNINVMGTENVIKACRENKIKRLIYTSSPSVVFDGNDMENADESAPYSACFEGYYPETKAIAEQIVLKETSSDLNTIILRPHLIWGPEDNHLVPGIINAAKRLKIIGKSDDLTDTVYIDNAADAHIKAAEKLKKDPSLSGRVYFISNGEPVSKWYLANRFLAAAGMEPIKGRVSERTAYMAGIFFEFFYKLCKIKKDPPMTRFAAKELATSHWFNISRAKAELGYDPVISIEQGLIKLKKWFDKQNA